MIPRIPPATPERQLLQEITANPVLLEMLDAGTIEALSKAETRLQFFQLFANPFLKDISTPEGIQLSLEVDQNRNADELYLHVECDDCSPIAIVLIPEADKISAIDLLEVKGQQDFFGVLAKHIQITTQSDDLPFPEKGRKNNEINEDKKKEILFGIVEKMLEKAA